MTYGALTLERVILRDNHTTGPGGGLSSLIAGTVQMTDCVGRDLKVPPFIAQAVATADQLGSETVNVRRLKFVCVPVDKNGAGISDPAAFLACYQVTAALLAPRPAVMVSTQFQASRFELKRPKLLCAPATTMPLP